MSQEWKKQADIKKRERGAKIIRDRMGLTAKKKQSKRYNSDRGFFVLHFPLSHTLGLIACFCFISFYEGV